MFVNTADREAGEDALGNPVDLADWLAGYGLVEAGTPATTDDLALALDLREGLRSLFLTHHDGGHPGGADDDGGHPHRTPPPAVVDGLQCLDRALKQLPVRVAVSGGVPRVEPAPQPPVRTALAHIGAVLVHADPAQLRRLKACRRDVCRWVFFDSSRNRGGTWCAMEICGARTKMQAYRKRNT
ncbi:CGNR zinc finger domain-containing protein [Arthrobacter sp. zg-Y179]|uniref:CGNR zinc finger domain-containing protein n=1 Tax=Arthrobacter sp. zg-Y179 TaxID=2894188 RepID=UPI002F407313|nr:CGNR zinc finger domain-containing protein [Arthrobacter sp. zg-Y179]